MIVLTSMLILTGLSTGFLSGLLGLGGGLISTPMFLHLLPYLGAKPEHLMHQAVATSLAMMIPSTLAASYVHYKNQQYQDRLILPWIISLCFGVCIGGLSFQSISSQRLRWLFIIYLIASIYYLYQRRGMIDHSSKPKLHTWYQHTPAALCVGLLSIWLGIGGGSIITPYLRWHDYSLRKAIAMSSLSGVFVGILGTCSMILSGQHQLGLSQHALGFVNYWAVLCCAPCALYAAQWGARTSHRLSEKTLQTLYLMLLSIITIDLIIT